MSTGIGAGGTLTDGIGVGVGAGGEVTVGTIVGVAVGGTEGGEAGARTMTCSGGTCGDAKVLFLTRI